MPRRSVVVVSIALTWCAAGHVDAETIYMNDGRKITARILKQDDKSVTLDWFGVPVTYWRDEISRIEGDGSTADAPPSIELATGESSESDPLEALAPAQRELVEDVLELSGLLDHAQQLGAQSEAQVDQRLAQRKDISPEQAAIIKQVIVDSYQPALLVRAIRERFAASFDERRFADLRAWYQQPLGMKMRQFEQAASTPEAAPDAEKFFATLENMPPVPSRLKLIERLDAATHSTENTLQLVMAMVDDLFDQGAKVDPQGAARERAKMELEGQRLLAQQRETYQAAVAAMLLFTYRGATDAELEQYIAFWESALGEWMNRLSASAFKEGVRQMSQLMTNQMWKRLDELKAKAAASQPASSAPSGAPAGSSGGL